MKKNYANLKRCILALMFLLTAAIAIYSCKKDRPLTQDEIKNELINEAKDFFENTVLANKQTIPNDQNYRHGLTKNLLWDKAYIRKISLGDAVIVPIKFDSDFRITNDDNTGYKRVTSYLIIYRDAKDVRHAEWVTLIPNITTQYASEKFIGTATIEDWNGNFIKAFAYGADGQVISVKLAESDVYKQVILRRLNCYTIHYYGHNYVEGVARSDYWYENGSETYCQNESGVDYGPNGGDYGDMGSGGGGTSGNGGNTIFEIKDSVKNACIKNALNLALAKNAVNEIKTLFYNAFGSNKNYNVVFADGSLSSTKDATTRTLLDPITGIITSTITFNTDVAGIRSEQYAVSTIYHEMVHAELRKLFPEDSHGKILIPSQHEYMAQNFVDKITASLKSVFPNLSDTDAWALSWGGLKQTSFFDLLTDANKTLIGETLMKYSDKDRYDKLGSYCN